MCATRADAVAPFLACALAVAAVPVPAEPSLDLSAQERVAFGAEIRALLLDEPEIVGRAFDASRPRMDYSDEIASDLDLIARHAVQLFGEADPGGAHLAVFGDGAMPAAAWAVKAARPDLRVTLHDTGRPEAAALARTLGLDLVPSYVMPDMMVRGDVPAAVLERYLDR